MRAEYRDLWNMRVELGLVEYEGANITIHRKLKYIASSTRGYQAALAPHKLSFKNITSFMDVVRVEANIELAEVGSAVYPLLASVCDHSCDPTTLRVGSTG